MQRFSNAHSISLFSRFRAGNAEATRGQENIEKVAPLSVFASRFQHELNPRSQTPASLLIWEVKVSPGVVFVQWPCFAYVRLTRVHTPTPNRVVVLLLLLLLVAQTCCSLFALSTTKGGGQRDPA